MDLARVAGTGLAVAALAACVPRTTPPPPEPRPEPEPQIQPAPPPPPPPINWQVGPLSPGDWSYRREGANSAAAFGARAPAFVVSCEPGARISLVRRGSAASGPMTVRTSYGDRSLPAQMREDRAGLVAVLAASDPLLDQMVFSRGRFAVEAPGLPPLIVPAWPEPARVVEECRR